MLAAIARAVAAGISTVDERADVRFGAQLRSLVTVSAPTVDAIHDVMRVLEAQAELRWMFSSYYCAGPTGGGVGILPVKVAHWLLAKSLALPGKADEALSLLEAFGQSNSASGFRVVAIYGAYTREPIVVDHKTRLIPVWEMWPSLGMDALADTFGDIHTYLPMAEDAGERIPAISVLVERFEMTPALRRDINDVPAWFREHDGAFQRLADLAYATALLAGPIPQVVSRWVDPDGLAAIPGLTGGSGGDVAVMEVIPRRFRWLAPMDPALAAARLQAFSNIGPDLRRALSVPLRRLSLASARREPVDRCIELGIALESLFVDGHEDSGFSAKVSTRGAAFTARNDVEKETNRQWLRAAYNLRSQAAHQGSLARGTRPVNGVQPSVDEVLERASDLCRLAINKFVDQGAKPAWP